MQPSYVYVNSEPGLFTVGFYAPNGKWNAESDHSSRDEAAARVRYLHGGVVDTPYVLVTVYGGVADVTLNKSRVDVDILDFDNLKETGPADACFSDKEWAYLKKEHPDLYEFYAPSRKEKK